MTRRYFAPDMPETGGIVALPPAEAQHACRVMRVVVGDPVVLFDGQGRETTARIESIGRTDCVCVADPAKTVSRELDTDLHLAIALPKPDRARELIERLTELGVSKVTPLVADHSQRPPSDSLIAKLHRTVIESCKQCQRNKLLELGSPTHTREFFTMPMSGRRLLAHPGAPIDALSSLTTEAQIVAAVGPEGGFSPHEIELAGGADFELVGLGSRIYRVETAATVIASIVSMGFLP